MKKRNLKLKKLIIIMLSSMTLLCIGGYIGLNLYVDSILNQVVRTEALDSSSVYATTIDENITNILVIGCEEDLATSIKVISINNKEETYMFTSLLSNTLVYLPISDTHNNLENAYRDGGIQELIATINYNFDLDVTQYIKYDVDSLQPIVDSIPKINIVVSVNEANELGLDEANEYALNGTEVKAYFTIDNVGNEFNQMDRETSVLTSLISSICTLDSLNIIGVLNESLGYIETNISNSTMKDGIVALLNLDLTIMDSYQFPSQQTSSIYKSVYLYGDGPHYILDDYISEIETLHANIYGDEEYSVSERVVESSEYISELFK